MQQKKGSYIEILLEKELYKSNTLQEVIQEAQIRGFNFTELRIGPVVHPGDWKSTEESTTKIPIIYLEKDKDNRLERALIVQGIMGDLYGLYEYRWIA